MLSSATQIAVVQSVKDSSTHLPLVINRSAPVPKAPSEHHVLVRILAVALNPNDHKMITHFNLPGNIAGCDFCGVIVAERGEDNDNNRNGAVASEAVTRFPAGTRVCGALFPYNPARS